MWKHPKIITSKGYLLRKVLEDIFQQNRAVKKEKGIGHKKHRRQWEEEQMKKVPGPQLRGRLNANPVHTAASSYRSWLSQKTKLRVTVTFDHV